MLNIIKTELLCSIEIVLYHSISLHRFHRYDHLPQVVFSFKKHNTPTLTYILYHEPLSFSTVICQLFQKMNLVNAKASPNLRTRSFSETQIVNLQ